MTDEVPTDLMQLFRPKEGWHVYDGLIKLKLVHARGFSVFLPDLLLTQLDGWKWFQPKYFSACLIHYLDQLTFAQLSVDVDGGPQVFVAFTKDRLVRLFADGSQLYRCRIESPVDLEPAASGSCAVSGEGEILLNLFHHTLPETANQIRRSGHFRPSSWNIQGTRTLANVGYAYFTSLSAIRSDDDLRRIAMASDGRIRLCPTNARGLGDTFEIEVYRESTSRRTAAIRVAVAANLLASQHVYRHAPRGDPVYYEVSHPTIARVGILPGQVIPFDGDRLNPNGDELKRFDYVVLGDADTREGLLAPYDEEETKALFLIERCESETFFDYWHRHANSDQITGRTVDVMRFK